MEEHELYGCPCCSGTIGCLFGVNETVRDLKEQAATGDDSFRNRGLDRASIGRRNFIRTGAAAASLAALMPKEGRTQAISTEETTIFTNANVLTVDDAFSEAEAIAIRGNRILAVGSNREVRTVAGKNAAVIDMQGKTVLPGFIDAHAHVISGAVADDVMEYVGMNSYATVDDVLQQIAQRASETPAGEWLVFRNFDPAVQEGAETLTFSDLDPISSEHPIFVLNASGHIAYANSKAFEVSGITNDVSDPPGGEFVRDAEGNLTGMMKNNVAFIQIAKNYPEMKKVEPVDALLRLLENWAQYGLTTVSELSLGVLSHPPGDVQIMTEAAQSGRMKARIRAYPFYTLGAEAWDRADVMQGNGNALARIAGYKLVADGSNQGFTGWQREPYLGSDNRGLRYMEPDEMTAAALERAGKGWHLAIHGNGDAAIDNILDTFQALVDAGVDMSRVRPRIEHCSILHDDQIARMKKLGVSASFLIGHVYYWGIAMRDKVFGEEKAQLLDRCRSAEKAGIRFTLHSDFMVTDPNPLHMIEMAVTRRTWKEPDYVLAPQETISVETAIRAMTSEAAWQLFSDHELGSLEPGKLADLVILEQDPRDVRQDEIKNIRILETWMDGRQVYSA
ncbi:amidohydrolase [Rhodovulum sulfidophilum]|uniref:Amidohydrolase n=1 Tax=Rhodovulum sulfidophilum TaxID=35806 RepID=A0A0D6B2R4_RHOSU|nr:amidohydrolase [Rhodovulum sulfidophilum]